MLDVLKEQPVASRGRDEPLRGTASWLFILRISDFVKREVEHRNFRTWHPEVQPLPRLQLGDPSSHKRLS